ncbi:MAG TPA: transposase [Acidimicrobiales bacterium]|nr:transposase [Acidimicrobiales bacterium]
METVVWKRPRPRRAFTDEFKADIIKRFLKGDRSIAAVAHDFDLTVSAVRGWVKQAQIDAGLEGRCNRRWRSSTVPGAAEQRALELIKRHFGPSAELDTRYVGDITFIWTWSGFAYLLVFFATIKRELITTRPWRSITELHRAVFSYIEGWSTPRRLHRSLGYMSPAQWEAAHRSSGNATGRQAA